MELREDVEGFVPLSHLGIDGMKQPVEFFEDGMELPLKVIKVDPQNKRIVLSVNAFFEGKPAEEIAGYRDAHPRKAVAEPAPETGGDEAAEAASDADYDDVDDVAEEPAAGETPAVEEPAAEEPAVVEEPAAEEPAVEAEPEQASGEEPAEAVEEETPSVSDEAVEEDEAEDKKETE